MIFLSLLLHLFPWSCCHASYRSSNDLSVPAFASPPMILLSCFLQLFWWFSVPASHDPAVMLFTALLMSFLSICNSSHVPSFMLSTDLLMIFLSLLLHLFPWSCCNVSYSSSIDLSVPASATSSHDPAVMLLTTLLMISLSLRLQLFPGSWCSWNSSHDQSVSAVCCPAYKHSVLLKLFPVGSIIVSATYLTHSLPPNYSDERSLAATNIKINWLLQFPWSFSSCNSPAVNLFL